MAKSAYLAHPVNLSTFLLKTAPKYHLIEHRTQKFLVGLFDRSELRCPTGYKLGLCLFDLNKIRQFVFLDDLIERLTDAIRRSL